MPFHFILGNLLAHTDNAVGALFLDGTGEMVDFASADFSPFQIRVLGAYLGIHLRQLDKILTASELGEAELVQLEHRGLLIHVMPLPDDYFLALLQRPPANASLARRNLLLAAREVAAEMTP
jgi:hypothetical protein